MVYRRSRRESPARAEELEHAIEEGIEFQWLTHPGGDPGQCRRAGSPACAARRWNWASRTPPAAAGRCAVEGSDFLIDVDTVIYALGTTANPIIAQTTPGLGTNKWGYIEIDERTGMTSIPGVFAGGDIVTGAATVILAMGAGKRAAQGMLEYMGVRTPDAGTGCRRRSIRCHRLCPKCRQVIEEDEICCAQVRYTWRCKSCFKLTTGLAIPYGKCFLCGGELEVIHDRDLGDSMRFRAIRDAVQFELNSFHFYKLARDKASSPEQRAVLERLYEAELDHLHELEEKYHAHLDREVVELSADEDEAARQLALPRHSGRRPAGVDGLVPGGARDGTAHARPFPETRPQTSRRAGEGSLRRTRGGRRRACRPAGGRVGAVGGSLPAPRSPPDLRNHSNTNRDTGGARTGEDRGAGHVSPQASGGVFLLVPPKRPTAISTAFRDHFAPPPDVRVRPESMLSEAALAARPFS